MAQYRKGRNLMVVYNPYGSNLLTLLKIATK